MIGKWAYTARILYKNPFKSIKLNRPPISHTNSTHLRDTSDHVVDKTPNSPQARNMFTSTLPDSKCDLVGLALEQPDVHVDMTDIFCEGTARSCDSDEAGLDGNRDALRDVEFFGLEDVPHLGKVV